MSLWRRALLGLAVCLAGGIALHIADHTSLPEHARDIEVAKAESENLNLGDCLLGRTDPSWPASYQAMCADLARGRDIDPDKDETAPPTLAHSSTDVSTLGLRETPATPVSVKPVPVHPVPVHPVSVHPVPASKVAIAKPLSVPSTKPLPVNLTKAEPIDSSPACLVDERGATTMRQASLSRVLPPKLAEQKTTGLRQPGVALIVEADCMVTSPVEGKVLYSGDFKGYRGVVIIRLTSGHQLIVAGLEGLKVKRGARVMRGTHLGTTTGDRAPALASTYGAATTSSLLYFDLRNAKGTGEAVTWLPQPG